MKRPSPKPSLVVLDAPQSFPSEAYRVLRSNLHYARPDAPLRTLLITSAAASEGKSTTVGNLGACVAQTDQRVLLIDADLRKPVLHTFFDRERTPGLSSYLAGDAPLDSVLCPTAIPNLSLLPSGPTPPNPAELLASKRMRELLEAVATRYELVLIDSSPVLAVSDVCGFAAMADGVLLVVRSGSVPPAVLRRARAQLDAVQGRLVAAVLNRFDARANGYSRGYYDRYESYYGNGTGRRSSGNARAR